MTIVRSAVEDADGLALSVTVSLYKVDSIGAAGVPEISPVAAFRLRLGCKDGVIDHFSGGTPPLA